MLHLHVGGRLAQTRRSRRLSYPDTPFDRLTHYLFRYPAKFHPPVARTLVEMFSKPGHLILDPFCGSGTLLVEAMVANRRAIGVDIDPVAVFVSRVKTRRVSMSGLRKSASLLLRDIEELSRSEAEYEKRQFDDLAVESYRRAVRRDGLVIPRIPNIFHWFRRYVVIDLARLRHAIQTLDVPRTHREFFLLCLASIIRNSSNADPVPVSGLEVTSYMTKRDLEGRVINPFNLFKRLLRRALREMEQFCDRTHESINGIRVTQGDATHVDRYLRTPVDVVITSPPYHSAVDYYRRHTLEMYWLDLVSDHSDRLDLLPKYIGRTKVTRGHPFVKNATLISTVARRWEKSLRRQSPVHADAFKHYVVAMRETLASIAQQLRRGSLAVFVVGKSSWNGNKIPTVELFQELADKQYKVVDRLWYPLKNRYMSYSRHNEASINREHVLVLKRT